MREGLRPPRGLRTAWRRPNPPSGRSNRCRALIAAIVSVVAAGPSLASDQTAVMLPVHQFVDIFNMGDAMTAPEGCASATSIIDDFPPHEWHGEGACQRWMDSYRVFAKDNGIDEMIMTLGNPRHVDITADRAYVVVPVDYTLRKGGKLSKKTGSILTFALKRDGNVWRVASWSWADG